MRRAPDGARGSARGGVDLIHASLSSAEKLDIARAPAHPAGALGPRLRVRALFSSRGLAVVPPRDGSELTKVSNFLYATRRK